MVCKQCGSPVKQGATICPNCGAKIKVATKRIELRTTGLERFTGQLKALDPGSRRMLEHDTTISERYVLGSMIGYGPFGQVYEAKDNELDVTCAIKVFRPELVKEERDRRRFSSTLKRALKLTQRNVMRVSDHGLHDAHPWVAMQVLDGMTLDKVIKVRKSKGERFEMDEVERIVEQLIAALGHINQEFAHGNLKPENILFLPDMIKVTDHYIVSAFPRAKVKTALKSSSYFAPELERKKAKLLPQCDVFSLGSLLSTLLFDSITPPPADDAILADDPVLAALAALCRDSRAKEGVRPATIEEFAEEFALAMDAGLVAAVAPASVPIPAPPVAPPPAPPGPAMAPTAGSGISGASESADAVAAEGTASDSRETPSKKAEAAEVEEDAVIVDELPEDDIETVEVSRAKPELGDLLPTNEVSRGAIPMPEKPELKPSEETVTMIKPAPAPPEESKPPVLLIGLGVLAAIIIIAVVSSSGKNDEVVAIADNEPAVASQNTDNNAKDPVPAAKPDMAAAKVEPAAPNATDVATAVAVVTMKSGDAVGKARAELVALAAATPEPDMGAASPDMSAPVAVAVATPPKDDGSGKAADPKNTASPTGDKGGTTSNTSTAQASKTTTPPGDKAGSKAPPKDSGKASDPPAAAGTTCQQGMVLVKSKKAGNVCIDRYEYPGRGKPKTRVSWFDAKKACESKGKRLCLRSEWTRACGGKYPWGKKWDANRCNTADEDGFERSLASVGSKKSCRSRSGAFDMVGNVFEWTAEKRIVGGSYNSEEDVARCGYSSGKSASSSAADIGFRCCADPR